jgi:hypothetical protein
MPTTTDHRPVKSGRGKAPAAPVAGATAGALEEPIHSDRPRRPPARRALRGISDIRRFFFRNDEPIYFISATNFNLLGIDEWVRRFAYLSSIDCFDGQQPAARTVAEIGGFKLL